MSATLISQCRTAYDPFAHIYARSMAEDFCRRALPIIDTLLLRRIPAHARVLDLCCGSGQMARSLCGRGFVVTGVDSSEQMLRLGRVEAPDLQLILADARQLSLLPVFDAAISTFNSLAHAPDTTSLRQIFTNVHACLKPGGMLLFDLTMEEGYTAKWRGSFGEVHDQVSWIVRPRYDAAKKIARNDVTVFRLDRTQTWQRSDFQITQVCHSEAEVRESLQCAGFQQIALYDAERDLGMTGEFGRRFCLAC